ncbi:MAG TPA: AAA family ATPase [Actinomycetota bacterium]|nr:AAA family ATPase [Actinomycetota bacterium]
MQVTVRPYRPEDLGSVLQLWEAVEGKLGAGLLSMDQLVDLIGSGSAAAFVGERDGRLLGAAVGAVSGAIGWLYRVVLDDAAAADDALAASLIARTEASLLEAGARKVVAPVVPGRGMHPHLARAGYAELDDRRLVEKRLAAALAAPSTLAELGGRMIDPGLWDRLRGMEQAKQIIERRVILPLAEPELAERHGVSPPKAIVLFGPPGTGKTTFAKGIASRLGWPFIELEPGELAGGGADRQAKALADTFLRIRELPSAVIFVDEVEDLASIRHEERRTNPSVTNEFMKQIPRLRQVPHHLLVCATNWVGRLDPAFLRPGRFDFILPVGPPDAAARRSIWERYVSEITDEVVALDTLVEASDLFTAADIEFAARKAAQGAFEREHFDGIARRAGTADFLSAIADTRPTLNAEMIEHFAQDTERFARD